MTWFVTNFMIKGSGNRHSLYISPLPGEGCYGSYMSVFCVDWNSIGNVVSRYWLHYNKSILIICEICERCDDMLLKIFWSLL